LFSCAEDETQADTQLQVLNELINDSKAPICPFNPHTDSITPISYGLPTEEMFHKEDSGLLVLGGCELGDYTYY
jgi:hypothetical protein